ncbi:MAG: acyl carrier protein [Thermoanaerobaculia bacterium]
MTDAEILAVIREAIAFAIPEKAGAKLDPDATIAELGISSITVLEIVGYVEDKLAVRFPDDALAQLNSVGGLMELIRSQGLPVPEPAHQEEPA